MLKALVFSMMLWISDTTGLPMPDDPPKILFAEKEVICTIIEPEIEYNPEKPCSTTALYEHKSQTMILPAYFDPNNLLHQAILVHELVHHAQNPVLDSYPCSQAREKQAYEVHMEYLSKAGVEDPLSYSGLNDMALFLLTTCPVNPNR